MTDSTNMDLNEVKDYRFYIKYDNKSPLDNFQKIRKEFNEGTFRCGEYGDLYYCIISCTPGDICYFKLKSNMCDYGIVNIEEI